jgi:acyl-CoA dehydrogenase
MATTLWLAAAISAGWALAYWQAPLWIWTITGLALLVLATLSAALPPAALVVLWVGLAAAVVLFQVRPIRYRLVSAPLLGWFRRSLPALSATEREVLDAGTLWWERELFSGRPDWSKLSALPMPALSAEEQAFLDGPVESLCGMVDAWEVSRTLDLPPSVWRYIREQGFFGLIIPRRYGGREFSALAHSAVVTKLGSRSLAAAVTVMVPNSLGPAKLLLRYGTEQQREYYLPRLARGEEIPCFALTSPEAGSDAASMTDTGVVCRGPHGTLGIRLNWSKRYITLAPVATLIGVAFKLHDPDHLLGADEDLGITLALVPRATPGISIGRRHLPLGGHFLNGPIIGRDVFVPLDSIIGGREGIGLGWRMLTECLAGGRAISLPALSCGAAQLACRVAGAYARVRRQFKLPIGRFEGVAEALAQMAGQTYRMDAARLVTLAALDAGERPAVVSAIVKHELTEHMRRVVNHGMDVQAGAAIMQGPSNLLARAYQAIPISIGVEGANILTRCLMIFGQGAVRCHPYLLKEMQAVDDPDPQRALQAFDAAVFSHLGLLVSNVARAAFHGLTGARLIRVPEAGPATHHYRGVARLSAIYAVVADASLLSLGGTLKRRERLSGRLADVLSQLYLVSAMLKRFECEGRPAAERPLLDWACEDALHRAQESLAALLRELPHRSLGWLLARLAFPFGRPWRPPSDRLGDILAAALIEPGGLRDRITASMYVPRGLQEPLGRLEDAHAKVSAAEHIERRVQQAITAGRLRRALPLQVLSEARLAGIITEQEAALLRAAEEARRVALAVDDFDPRELERIAWRENAEPSLAHPST